MLIPTLFRNLWQFGYRSGDAVVIFKHCANVNVNINLVFKCMVLLHKTSLKAHSYFVSFKATFCSIAWTQFCSQPWTQVFVDKSVEEIKTLLMNCFCVMVDQTKALRLISSQDHWQRFSPLQIFVVQMR